MPTAICKMLKSRRVTVALFLIASIGVGLIALETHVVAENSATDPSDRGINATTKKRHANRKTRQKANAAQEESTGSLPNSTTHGGADNPDATKTGEFSAQLDKAGASTCSNQLNALAGSTMGNVVKYNTVSNWSTSGGDKRAVSVAIGQKYKDGSAVPYGLSQIIASPNQNGSCDGFAMQVFPSPLSCEQLRNSIAAQHGQQIGELAGIPLMQDPAGRTMLVPTAANSCVLVSVRTAYAK